MIIPLFIFMAVIGGLALLLGYTQRIPWAVYTGYAIFFLLFTGFRADGVQYESSTQINTSGNNYIITPVYSTYTSNWIATILAMVCVFALVYTWFREKRYE